VSLYPSKVRQYFDSLKNLLATHPLVMDFTAIRERISSTDGLVQFDVEIVKHYRLKVFEYYSTVSGVVSYRYHLQDNKNTIVRRWDNAPHHSQLATFPDHVHTPKGVEPCKQPDLKTVLDLIDGFWN